MLVWLHNSVATTTLPAALISCGLPLSHVSTSVFQLACKFAVTCLCRCRSAKCGSFPLPLSPQMKHGPVRTWQP